MGCGCRRYLYTPKPKPNPEPEPPLSCPPGQRRVQARAGGTACEPDIDLGQCTEFEILVDGVCTAVKECVPPAILQSDGSCQVPNNVSSCKGGQTWDDVAKACVASVCLPGQKRDAVGGCSTECDAPLSWGGIRGVCMNPDGTEYTGGVPRCLEGETFDSATNRCRKRCPTALEVYDEALGRCIHDISKGDCPVGEVLDQSTGSCKKRCLPPKIEVQNLGCVDPCMQGQVRQVDGSCKTVDVRGCTDKSMLNYDPSAVQDDGSCKGCNIWFTPLDGKCVPCDKSGVIWDFELGAFSVTEFLGDLGIDTSMIPSIDNFICDYMKDDVLSAVHNALGFLEGEVELSDAFAAEGFPLPAHLTFMPVDFIPFDFYGTTESLAEIANAALHFGEGDISEAILKLLESVPMFGDGLRNILDNTEEAVQSLKKLPIGGVLGDILVVPVTFVGKAWDVIEKVLNDLPDLVKDQIVSKVAKTLGNTAAVPGPQAIPAAIAHALILFGKKQWDEALGALFGFLKWMKFTGKAAKMLVSVFKPFLKVLKTLSKDMPLLREIAGFI